MELSRQEETQPKKFIAYTIALFAALTIYATTIQTTSLTIVILGFSIFGIIASLANPTDSTNNNNKLRAIFTTIYISALFATLYNAKDIDNFYLSEHMEPARSFKCLMSASSAPYWTEKQRLECNFLKR